MIAIPRSTRRRCPPDSAPIEHLLGGARVRVEPAEQGERLHHGQLAVEAGGLQDQADPFPPGPVRPPRAGPEDADGPRGRGLEALEYLDRGGLARAIRAEEGRHLASRDREADIVHRGEPAVPFDQVLDLDCGHFLVTHL
jgi:hypothetical protein